MKKFISIITIFATLFSTTNLSAQEKPSKLSNITNLIDEVAPETPPAEKALGAAISPLKKFQQSPFTGVLLSPLSVATLIAELNAKEEEIKIEVDKAVKTTEANFAYEKSIMQNQCTADRKIMEATIEEKSNQIKILDSALQTELESRPNTLAWTFIGLAIGVVTATAAAGTIVAVTQ